MGLSLSKKKILKNNQKTIDVATNFDFVCSNNRLHGGNILLNLLTACEQKLNTLYFFVFFLYQWRPIFEIVQKRQYKKYKKIQEKHAFSPCRSGTSYTPQYIHYRIWGTIPFDASFPYLIALCKSNSQMNSNSNFSKSIIFLVFEYKLQF